MPNVVETIASNLLSRNIGGEYCIDAGQRYGQVHTSATGTVVIRLCTFSISGKEGQRSVKSTSALDTAAGTGARKVRLRYYDEDLNGPHEEIITMNGTTAVNTTATNIKFIEELVVIETGTQRMNKGIINLYSDPDATGFVMIDIGYWYAGYIRSISAHHHVAPGRVCFITDIMMTATGIGGVITMRCYDPTTNFTPKYQYLTPTMRIVADQTTKNLNYVMPIAIKGPALIEMTYAPKDDTAAAVYAGFNFYEK